MFSPKNTNFMWLLKTWNVANATEKLNLKLYFIYFNINYHIWQIAIVLDCIALEENAICTFHTVGVLTDFFMSTESFINI